MIQLGSSISFKISFLVILISLFTACSVETTDTLTNSLVETTEGSENIIWFGDFETGNLMQWHIPQSKDEVKFNQIPPYGRPLQYGGQNPLHVGDGSLLSLVHSPARFSSYAAKFTVKNSANGSEPVDCDGSVCTRRRTELTVQTTLSEYYNALPYLSERWFSFSVYVPSDWEETKSGWGPAVFQIKPRNEGTSGLSGMLQFTVYGSSWKIYHRWSPLVNPSVTDIPWQQQMFYTGDEGGLPYPRAGFWEDGLADFPDVNASHSALQSINKGGWTDWIVQVRFDARGSVNGGTGFMTVWKRENTDHWVKVLHILPKRVTRGGMTFDHGIGYNAPAGNNNGGFGIKAGLYMENGQVLDNVLNRVIYLDNIKVGGESAKFSDLSPD